VLLFGQGGTAVEVIRDRAVALPPLNLVLARELVARTRIARLLAGYRDRPAADMTAIYLTLIKISQLVTDLPEISELDINPLFADDQGVLALDARMRVQSAPKSGVARLAIRPYPQELEESINIAGRQICLRPIRPEDEPQHQEFFSKLSPDDIHMRFFASIRELAHSELARFTQIDFDREMAFIATGPDEQGRAETLGVARSIADPDNQQAEVAIIVRSDLKGQGLGRILLDKLIRYCRSRGTKALTGETLRANYPMLALAKKLGFEFRSLDDGQTVALRLDLEQAS
jgi:acetyltransferase